MARGIFERMVRLLGGFDGQEPIECKVWIEPGEPIVVPAKGRVFDFLVYPSLTWNAMGMSREELRRRLSPYLAGAKARIRHRAADLANGYPPHHAEAYERALADVLTAHPMIYDDAGLRLVCEATARIESDERIRASLQPTWQRRVVLEAEHELDIRRARLIRERTQAWATVIEDLQVNPTALHASVLAEEPFAQVLRTAVETQQKDRDKFDMLLRNAAAEHRQVGAYELAKAYQAALEAFVRHQGVDVGDRER